MRRRLALLWPMYMAVSIVCYGIAFLLRLESGFNSFYLTIYLQSLPVVLSLKLLAFQLSRDWQRDSRYYTLRDFTSLAVSTFIAAALLLALNAVDALGTQFPVPISVILIDMVLQTSVFGFIRVAPRLFREIIRPKISSQRGLRTLIYGDGPQIIGILRVLQTSENDFDVVGVVSTSPKDVGCISGVRVYRPGTGWRTLVERFRCQCVLVPSSIASRTTREITSDCAGLNVQVHVIPSIEDIASGRCTLGVRDVSVADLLRRKPTTLKGDAVSQCFAGQRILVTGAAGSIGSELCRQLLEYQPESLILVDQSEFGMFNIEQEFNERTCTATELHFLIADITNRSWLQQIMADQRPHVVFHAAAYKHVPLMEANVQAAVRNNVLGTRAIVDLADIYGVQHFVMVSTDKAVRPTSVMGATKFLAEKYVQATAQHSDTRYITVRFGNVLNSAGSVIPTFRRQIETGGPVTVTDPEMRRFFMTIPEASELVVQAGALGNSGDVFILEMGEPIRILDLAKDMIRLSGRRYPDDIDIIFSGTRPGEKLYEELFYESEENAVKVHDKILRAYREPINPAELHAYFANLTKTLDLSSDETSRSLWQIVDKYVKKSECQPLRRKAA